MHQNLHTYIPTYIHTYIQTGAKEESPGLPGQPNQREQGSAGEDSGAGRHAGRHIGSQERHPTQPSRARGLSAQEQGEGIHT